MQREEVSVLKYLLILMFLSGTLYSQKGEDKIEYKYKKEEYFDFDALEVQGQLLSPGDLTSNADKRVKFQIKNFIRKDFDDYIREDLIDIH